MGACESRQRDNDGDPNAEDLYLQQDYVRAGELFEQAAAQGHADAANSRATMYYYGKGGSQDSARAAELYKQAAAQGHPIAQCNLATLYRDGNGVQQDYVRAAELYEQAAAQGHEVALAELQGTRLQAERVKAKRTAKEADDTGKLSTPLHCFAFMPSLLGPIEASHMSLPLKSERHHALLRISQMPTLLGEDGKSALDVDVEAENISGLPVMYSITTRGRFPDDCEELAWKVIEAPGDVKVVARCTMYDKYEHVYDMSPHFWCDGLSTRRMPTQLIVTAVPAEKVEDGWRFVDVPQPEVWSIHIRVDASNGHEFQQHFLEQNRTQLCEYNVLPLTTDNFSSVMPASPATKPNHQNSDDDGSIISTPTSCVSLESTIHSRKRLKDRGIQKKLLQANPNRSNKPTLSQPNLILRVRRSMLQKMRGYWARTKWDPHGELSGAGSR